MAASRRHPVQQLSVAKKVFKGILATDSTDDYRTNFILLAPTKTGPGKKPPRFANRDLDKY